MYEALVLSTEKTKILVLFPEIDPTFASGTQFTSTVNWNKNGIGTQGGHRYSSIEICGPYRENFDNVE